MFGTVLQPGDVYEHRMPGGGGWGDPHDRDPAAVALDVLDEKVSEAAARADYGVVVAVDGTVDGDSTAALRRSRRNGRG
jgi:N-methylhydantoinase B